MTLAPSAAPAGGPPEAVSPGEIDAISQIRDGCPTFSWGFAAEAELFELVVYPLRVSEDREVSKPLLEERLPGSTLSWTPSLERCLEAGGPYAWFVRALSADETTD